MCRGGSLIQVEGSNLVVMTVVKGGSNTPAWIYCVIISPISWLGRRGSVTATSGLGMGGMYGIGTWSCLSVSSAYIVYRVVQLLVAPECGVPGLGCLGGPCPFITEWMPWPAAWPRVSM